MITLHKPVREAAYCGACKVASPTGYLDDVIGKPDAYLCGACAGKAIRAYQSQAAEVERLTRMSEELACGLALSEQRERDLIRLRDAEKRRADWWAMSYRRGLELGGMIDAAESTLRTALVEGRAAVEAVERERDEANTMIRALQGGQATLQGALGTALRERDEAHNLHDAAEEVIREMVAAREPTDEEMREALRWFARFKASGPNICTGCREPFPLDEIAAHVAACEQHPLRAELAGHRAREAYHAHTATCGNGCIWLRGVANASEWCPVGCALAAAVPPLNQEPA